MAEDLLVPLTLLEANIEVDLITSSLNIYIDILLILLLYFLSISSIILIEDIVLLNLLNIIMLNYKSKTFNKSLCLEMLKHQIRVKNNITISRLYIIAFKDTLNYASNLGSKLIINNNYF